MNICGRHNRKKTKIFYFAEWSRGPGERQALDIFTFAKPKNQTEKNHNKETLALLDVKKSQLVIETQAIGTGFILLISSKRILWITIQNSSRTISRKVIVTFKEVLTTSPIL